MLRRRNPRRNAGPRDAAWSPQAPKGFNLNPGTLVEVVSDEDGLRGAHFAAVVVGPSAKSLGGYTVEYESLVESEDSDRLLREDLPARVLRPRPPKPPSTPPAEHAAVDARIDDVWWIGVALGRVGARGKVRVCFPDIREVMEFDAADVRPHLDWVDGEWRSPDIMEIPKTMPYAKGMQIEVSKLEDNSVVAWSPAVVTKTIWKNNLLVNYTVSKYHNTALPEEIVDVKDVRPCPPGISFCINDEVEAFQGDCWWLGVITNVHPELKYTFKSYLGREFKVDQKFLRLRYDWFDDHWEQVSKVAVPQDVQRSSVAKSADIRDKITQPNQAAQARIAELEKEVESLSRAARIAELEKEVESLSRAARISELEKEVESLSRAARIAELEKEVESLRRQHDETHAAAEVIVGLSREERKRRKLAPEESATARLAKQIQADAVEIKRLRDALGESASAYAGLKVAAANAERKHQEARTAMEEHFAARVSTLEDELHGIIAAGRAVCQAAYLQPEASGSAKEVASQLAGVPARLREKEVESLSRATRIAELEKEVESLSRAARIAELEKEVESLSRAARIAEPEKEVESLRRQHDETHAAAEVIVGLSRGKERKRRKLAPEESATARPVKQIQADAVEIKRLRDALGESASAYAGLKVAAANAERTHQEAQTAMEKHFAARVSTLEDELHGIIAAGHAVCQAAYLQPEASGSAREVASRLAGVPARLEEIAHQGLLRGAQIALVTVGALHVDVDISSIRGKPASISPEILEDLYQKVVKPAEALIADMDPL